MRSPEVDRGDVGLSLLMRSPGRIEALTGSFSPLREGPSAGQASLSEHSEDRRGKDDHNPLLNFPVKELFLLVNLLGDALVQFF